MEDRKMIASDFIEQGYPKQLVLQVVGIPRSSYYYQPKPPNGKRGIAKSTCTITTDGEVVSNTKVVAEIKEILSEEFVDYGYLKVTHWLRQEKNYIINPKKVYRLMGEEGLLNKASNQEKQKQNKRNWVKELVPPAKIAFDYLEFDIKYFSIQERVICQQYEFDNLEEIRATLNRFIDFYNFRRIHSGVGYQSPYKFLLSLNIDMEKFDVDNVFDAASLHVEAFT